MHLPASASSQSLACFRSHFSSFVPHLLSAFSQLLPVSQAQAFWPLPPLAFFLLQFSLHQLSSFALQCVRPQVASPQLDVPTLASAPQRVSTPPPVTFTLMLTASPLPFEPPLLSKLVDASALLPAMPIPSLSSQLVLALEPVF